MAGGLMSQVTGMVPGMKKEEEVPDVAPQEGEYQEYTVSTAQDRRINFNEQAKNSFMLLQWIFHWNVLTNFNNSMTLIFPAPVLL